MKVLTKHSDKYSVAVKQQTVTVTALHYKANISQILHVYASFIAVLMCTSKKGVVQHGIC